MHSINFNKLLVCDNINDIIKWSSILIFHINNEIFYILTHKNKYYKISNIISNSYSIIHYYLQQYKNTSYFFQYRYTDYDTIFQPCIQIVQIINNQLINRNIYIFNNYINDDNNYFSSSVQSNLIKYYKDKLYSIFESCYLLHRL